MSLLQFDLKKLCSTDTILIHGSNKENRNEIIDNILTNINNVENVIFANDTIDNFPNITKKINTEMSLFKDTVFKLINNKKPITVVLDSVTYIDYEIEHLFINSSNYNTCCICSSGYDNINIVRANYIFLLGSTTDVIINEISTKYLKSNNDLLKIYNDTTLNNGCLVIEVNTKKLYQLK
jgi:hypothetical protein